MRRKSTHGCSTQRPSEDCRVPKVRRGSSTAFQPITSIYISFQPMKSVYLNSYRPNSDDLTDRPLIYSPQSPVGSVALMAPRRAQTWPASMAEDPDVLSLDTDGRLVICRLCQEYQHVHGGHPPRPVRMTTRFGTRAWLLHKRRNMAHTRDRSWQIDLVRDADASEDEASAEHTAAEADTAAPEPSLGSSVVVEWQATADPRNRSRSGQISHDTLHSSSSFDINGITPNPPPSLTSSRQVRYVAIPASLFWIER